MLSPILNPLNINVDIAACKTITPEKWNYQGIIQPFNKLYLVTKGNGHLTYGNKHLHLVPGRLYLIPPSTALNSYCRKSIRKYWAHFSLTTFSGLELFNILSYEPERKLENVSQTRQLFDRLLETFNGNSLSDKLELDGIIRILVSPFLSGVSEEELSKSLKSLSRFENVLKHIEDNLTRPISLAELAKINHVSPQHFATVFKKHLGISPIKYRNRRRVEKAQILLWQSKDSLAEIAEQIGFDDVFYFSRLFKSMTGISPDHFRKQQQPSATPS